MDRNDGVDLRAVGLTELSNPVWRTVASDMPACAGLSASSDGRRLACVRTNVRYTLQRLDLTQALNAPAVLAERTGRIGAPSVSPDGRMIAVPMPISGVMRLVTMPINGGEPVPLETAGTGMARARWSPDGRHIFYLAFTDDKPRGWLLDVAQHRSKSVDLPGLSTNWIIAWTPDGDIAWQQNTPDSLLNFRVRDLETNDESLLVDQVAKGFVFNPVFSPKGDQLAVAWNRPKQPGLWVLTWPERRARFLSEYRRPLGWTHDGTAVFAHTDSRTELQLVTASSGAVRSVLKLERGTIVDGTPTADGRYFVLTVVERQSDAWLISNFDPLVPQ